MLGFLIIFICLIALAIIFLQLGFINISYFFSLTILIILVLVLLSVIRESFRVLFFGNAPYVPTSRKLIKKILTEVDFKDNALVYELGCGDAKVLRELIKHKNLRAIGYEYFVVPYIFAKIAALFSKGKLKVYCQDFFKVNLSEADYLFCFLIDREMDRLEEKLNKELKPGTLVISNTFKFKNWQPEKVLWVNEQKKSILNNKIYIYRK